MFSLDRPLKTPLFSYYSPLGNRPLGFVSVPHSGETVPEEFHPFLSGNEKAYREDVDFQVNELINIQELQKAGVAVLVSHIHRVCVDLNRAENNCVLFWKENTKGEQLVGLEPSAEDIARFVETYHRPYYEIMKTVLRELEKVSAGAVSMIDLHSMPSAPTAYHMKQNPNQKTHRPDFCLSDRRGKTCVPEFINLFRDHLAAKGFEATLNDPYIGGHVTEWVDQFRTNNIQIEVKRSIYMDEIKKELLTTKVEALRPILTAMIIEGFTKFQS